MADEVNVILMEWRGTIDDDSVRAFRSVKKATHYFNLLVSKVADAWRKGDPEWADLDDNEVMERVKDGESDYYGLPRWFTVELE